MAGAIVNKVLDFLGLEQENEEENINNYAEEVNLDDEETEERGLFGRKSKIVNMPQVQSVKMVITQPTSFEQSEEICNY